jgi:tetratricopeptide (TPR) repeat protein
MWVLKSWHRALLIVILAVLAVTALVWIAHSDPAINYLPRYGGTNWIVFPTAPDARAHWSASLDATFRREFVLSPQPASARLSIRAMRRAEVKINGVSIHVPRNRNWKLVSDVAVPEVLREGVNIIEVRAFNQNAPPALWVLLTADGLTLRSDQTWEVSFAGSAWRNAALASAAKIPEPGNPIANDERTFDAAKKIWPLWILLIGIASALMVLWHATLTRQKSFSLEWIAILLVCAVWLFLFWNNARLVPFHAGFDYKEHLKYVEYIQQHWAVPSPSQGFEMYHPPFYYFIAAGILSLCKQSISDAGSIIVLRALGACFGLAQCVLVFLTLRLLLPVRTALVGLLLAAFLPMHLYLMHYVTNELLSATLATLTIYLCLLLLKNETPRVPQFAFVGLALGATLLTKATGVFLVPIVVGAICARGMRERVPFVIWLRNVGLLFAICLAVCGWYYARIWLRFGTPLLGNWDAISGFAWWQDPGYRTAADYFRFGRSLINPLFSGFAGFFDGFYSTLWGDGLLGGSSSVSVAWNLTPMIAGYLCAVVPAVLILAGAGVAIVRFVRRPSAELFLLLGFSAVVVLGLSLLSLKVPSYAQAKAFYGLSAVTPLCFFGAVGYQTLTHGWRRSRFIIGALLIVWALNSLVTFCIFPSVSQHLYAVKALGQEGKIEQAAIEASKAVEGGPSDAEAHGYRALSLSELGDDAEAVKQAERAVELAPLDSAAHLYLAIAVKRVDVERAIREARRAIELGPENSSAYQVLMKCLVESGRYHDATALGKEWLTVSPFDVAAHSSLAVAMAETGELAGAAGQLGYVIMLRPNAEDALTQLHQIVFSLPKTPAGLQQLRDISSNAPDSPRMLDELAWLLATYPDSTVRDGAEAVRLAERACDLTDRSVPALLATLSAAYAESGDFSRAVASGEEALTLARSQSDSESIKLSEHILTHVRANLPYHHEPEQ